MSIGLSAIGRHAIGAIDSPGGESVASQTNTASGGLTFNGDGSLAFGLALAANGSISFNQGASISYGAVKNPTGSLLFSGNAGMSSGGPSIPGSDFNWRSRGYGR